MAAPLFAIGSTIHVMRNDAPTTVTVEAIVLLNGIYYYGSVPVETDGRITLSLYWPEEKVTGTKGALATKVGF